jgi:hypothetical protein
MTLTSTKNLPFTRRTTTAVTIFACMTVAYSAWSLPGLTVPQVTALHLDHAELFSIYKQVIHQDVANQESVLDGLISQAATAIIALNITMQGIGSTPTSAFDLADMHLVTANAVYVMINVQAAE